MRLRAATTASACLSSRELLKFELKVNTSALHPGNRRYSLNFMFRQDRKHLLPALRAIYRAETADMVEQRLAEFDAE